MSWQREQQERRSWSMKERATSKEQKVSAWMHRQRQGEKPSERLVMALIMLKLDKQFGFYSKMNWKVTKRFQDRYDIIWFVFLKAPSTARLEVEWLERRQRESWEAMQQSKPEKTTQTYDVQMWCLESLFGEVTQSPQFARSISLPHSLLGRINW